MSIIEADIDALKQARRLKNLGRVAAAKQAGISLDHLRSIERGRRQPSLNVAFKLAKAYGVQIDNIIRTK